MWITFIKKQMKKIEKNSINQKKKEINRKNDFSIYVDNFLYKKNRKKQKKIDKNRKKQIIKENQQKLVMWKKC